MPDLRSTGNTDMDERYWTSPDRRTQQSKTRQSSDAERQYRRQPSEAGTQRRTDAERRYRSASASGERIQRSAGSMGAAGRNQSSQVSSGDTAVRRKQSASRKRAGMAVSYRLASDKYTHSVEELADSTARTQSSSGEDMKKKDKVRSSRDVVFDEPINHEQERIQKWLKQVRFKKNALGGVNEADVWKKISELNALYEAALSAERARYDAMLAARVDMAEQTYMDFQEYERASDEN